MKWLTIFILGLVAIALPSSVFAEDSGQFITIVNPVRVSNYTGDLSENLRAQYETISGRDLPATWLLTYDVFLDKKALTELKKMGTKQELGLFLEITPKLAEVSGVTYNQTDSWHRAKSVFLSGYIQEDRKKLIDAQFAKFKELFGGYPTSVGSWWTDAFSLSYMREKYGVTANLGLADQFETDGYQVWGTYWSTPYIPNKYHLGIPAGSSETKLDVVNLQWAPREPGRGYQRSVYSTQDYKVLEEGLGTDYFERLVRLYGEKHGNQFGQVVVGLESDLVPETYRGEFDRQMKVIKSLKEGEEFDVLTMREFSEWYRREFNLSPAHKIEENNVVWYQSPYYRVGVRFEDQETKIFDLRVYNENFEEPYYKLPNGELNLSIYIPAIFDEAQNSNSVWNLKVDKDSIEFRPGSILIKKWVKVPELLKKSGLVDVKWTLRGVEIIPKRKFTVGAEGYIFNNFSVETKYFLRGKRNLLSLFFGKNWDKIRFEKYWVSQSEVDALQVLAAMPAGRILVYHQECLGCEWTSKYQPAALANLRGYVRKFSKKPVVKNQKVFTALSREESSLEFKKTGARYIYLVKYEDYEEKLPFSPGDLSLKRVYANANADVWRVEE